MPSPEAVRHYEERSRLARSTAAAAVVEWRHLDPNGPDRGWARVLRRILAILTLGQRRAAGTAGGYMRRAVRERGAIPRPRGEVDPEAFTGRRADGRDLESLLRRSLEELDRRLAAGEEAGAAMRRTEAGLARAVRTEVADAGRGADGVAATADTEIAGYERVVVLPACGRCIILAGRLYRWSTGFRRHPQCDCEMYPVTKQEWRGARPENTPEELFARMSRAEQDKAFTRYDAEAIRDGADMGRVVNARRDLWRITSTPGRVRKRTRERVAGRWLPEDIYRRATDRDETIELLHKHGYLF